MIKKSWFLATVFCMIVTLSYGQRNVVMVIADDLGTDYLGFYENYKDTANLPNLRRLLSKGVRFTNAMANPVCSPTRAGILTGRYSFRTGVGDAVGGAGSATLDTNEAIIPRLLKKFNPFIKTANIGKWHLHLATPLSNYKIPNLIGYDQYCGNFLGALNSYINWTIIKNGISSTTNVYATTQTTNDAIDWVKTTSGKPFFLWLAYNAPHTPLHLPPAGLYTQTNLTGTMNDINANPKSYFKASLEALDHEFGRLLDTLSSLKLLDNTDIIFIGDNGNGIRSSQIENTARSKGTIYQYGVNVPFLISGPSVINGGRVSEALVNTVDLFPTILELMGDSEWQSRLDASKPLDGVSLAPILSNTKEFVRDWTFTEIFKVAKDSADGKAIRNAEYKLLKFDDGRTEFYNLKNDSGENINLLDDTLSNVDNENLQYLCSELHHLTGLFDDCYLTNNVENLRNHFETYIFPNPMSHYMTVKVEKPNLNVRLEMYNLFGQKVKSNIVTDKETYIDVSDIKPGSYVVKIFSDQSLELAWQRVVINR